MIMSMYYFNNHLASSFVKKRSQMMYPKYTIIKNTKNSIPAIIILFSPNANFCNPNGGNHKFSVPLQTPKNLNLYSDRHDLLRLEKNLIQIEKCCIPNNTFRALSFYI